jgi:hypothetical protein
LVGRVNQYLGGWGLGLACAELGRTYNDAPVAPLRGGGYAETVFSALRQVGYARFVALPQAGKRSSSAAVLGITESSTTRPLAIGAIEQALLTGEAEIPSREVIEAFADCVVDRGGRIVADPKDPRLRQDFAIAGYALYLIQARAKGLPTVAGNGIDTPSMRQYRRMLEQSMGRDPLGRTRGTYPRDREGAWR